MINTIVHSMTPDYVMLIEEDEEHEIIIKADWLPKGFHEGDMVEIIFKLKPRKVRRTKIFYLPEY